MCSLCKIDKFKLGKKETLPVWIVQAERRVNSKNVPADCRKTTPFLLLTILHFVDFAAFL